MNDLSINSLREYIRRSVCESFEAFSVSSSQEAPGTDLLFRKTMKSIMLQDAIKEAVGHLSKVVSTGNMMDMKKLLKMIQDRIALKHPMKVKKELLGFMKEVGISSEQGLGRLLAEEAESLMKAGVSYKMIKEGRSKDRHKREGKELIDSRRYMPGTEIDLTYNGDGFDGCEHHVVVRTQDGQGPLMLYGYNGTYISNDFRNMYAYETGEAYMYCSGIQLETWKKVDDTKKRSCARDHSLIV